MPGCEEIPLCAQQDQGEQLQAQYERIRQSILQDADEKMTAKVEEMWAKGKQMMSKEQKRQQAEQERLARELQICTEKQNALEQDNAQMKRVLAGLLARLGMGGSAATNGMPPGSPFSGWTSSPDFFTSPLGAALSANQPSTTLPDCPPFPIVADPASAKADGIAATTSAPPGLGAASLSIAQALDHPLTSTPKTKAKPLSLAESLPATPATSSPDMIQSVGMPLTFSFTLRKADDTDLGLQVSHMPEGTALKVESVDENGAMGAWNRLTEQSAPHKKVVPGDQIVSVNGITEDISKMLEECKNKQLLKLSVNRGSCSGESQQGVVLGGSLRAEATEFVPGGTVPSGIAAGASANDTTTSTED